MPKLEQAGVGQPNDIDQPKQTQQQTSGQKTQAKPKPKDDKDLPGAEGPLSAGANEDTYD